MRRSLIATLAAGSLLGAVAAPVSAAPAMPAMPEAPGITVPAFERGWEPAPSAPWDVAAGVRCDFAIHGEPVVDEVQKLLLQQYPDGTPKRELYSGDLVVRITNVETGASTDADASGDAVIEYRPDGTMSRWYVRGPVLVGVGEDGGNLPRGMWIVDGVFTIDFTPEGKKNITMVHGTTTDMCAEIA